MGLARWARLFSEESICLEYKPSGTLVALRRICYFKAPFHATFNMPVPPVVPVQPVVPVELQTPVRSQPVV